MLAKLWATNLLTPASRAAATSVSVPSVRSRLVCTKELSRFFENCTSARAVASWTIASGSASRTALRTAPPSSRSSTIGSAPSARMRSDFSGEVEVPITSCPRSINWGTSRVPIAPLAPTTKTLIVISFRVTSARFAGLVV